MTCTLDSCRDYRGDLGGTRLQLMGGWGHHQIYSPAFHHAALPVPPHLLAGRRCHTEREARWGMIVQPSFLLKGSILPNSIVPVCTSELGKWCWGCRGGESIIHFFFTSKSRWGRVGLVVKSASWLLYAQGLGDLEVYRGHLEPPPWQPWNSRALARYFWS
jgi:hypothetical protein